MTSNEEPQSELANQWAAPDQVATPVPGNTPTVPAQPQLQPQGNDSMEIDSPVTESSQSILEALKRQESRLQEAFRKTTLKMLTLTGADGTLDTTNNLEALGVYQKNEKIKEQLKQCLGSIEMMERDERMSRKRKSDEMKEAESAQKSANAHYNAIDAEA